MQSANQSIIVFELLCVAHARMHPAREDCCYRSDRAGQRKWLF